jgi:competence protein ComEC
VELVAAAALAAQWCAAGGWSWSRLTLATAPPLLLLAVAGSPRPRVILAMLAVAVLSAWQVRHALEPSGEPGHVLEVLAGSPRTASPVRVEGRVLSVRARDGASTRIVVEVDRVGWQSPRRMHGRVALYVRSGGSDVVSGERVAFESTLRRIENFGNFGEPDWAAWNARRGVFVTGFAWSVGAIERMPGPSGRRDRFRAELRAAIGTEGSRGLVAALVTGDRRGLTEEVVGAVRAAGLSHVLAISGLHVGLVAGVALWVTRIVMLHTRFARGGLDVYRPAVLAAATAMGAYALVGTGGVSIARAMVMGAVALWPAFTGGRGRPFRGLAWAALVVSLGAPGAVVEPGFQLSFAAAGAIVAWVAGPRDPRDQGHDRGAVARAGARIVSALAISTVAWAATAPLVALHFHRISWVAPAANLAAAVPVAATVLLGLAGATVWPFSPQAAVPLFSLASIGAASIVFIARAFAALPFAETAVPAPGPPLAAVLVSLVLVTACRSARGLAAALAVVAAVLIAVAAHARYRADRMDVVFASVGQGDATIVRLPGGRVVVVDAGGRGRGRLVLAPLLRRMHVGRIDYLVLTHVQTDHWGGAPYLSAEMEVGEVWHPGGGCESASFASFLDGLVRSGVVVVDVSAHWGARGRPVAREGTEGWTIDAPWPRHGGRCDDNDRSVVVRILYEGTSILLPGDLEQRAERALLGMGASMSADVLKVPHHGSATSSTPAFLDAVGARIAVVSAGLANGYGFPRPDVVERYRERGMQLFRTDLDGAIHVVVDADGARAVAAKRR